MSSYSSQSVTSTKRKEAFSEELSAVLGKRGVVATSEETTVTTTHISEVEGGEIVFSANQDFLSDDLDALTLHRGDQVIVLETGGVDPSKRLKLDPDLDLGVDVGLLDNSAARHKIAVRPKRKHTDSRHRDIAQDERWLVQLLNDPMQQGWVPAAILTPHDDSPEKSQVHDAKYRREAVIRELVETEEEFGRDIQQVVNFYMKPLENKNVPAIIRDNKDLIFGNLKQIAEFHNTVLIEGVKYYANEPRMLGKTFLRLERDFDKHVTYCRDEPLAQDFLVDNIQVRDFFEELSQQLGDDKSLSEHLKLPIQRINDYQLLLKELVKYSNRLGEDTTDLGKALELMLAVPHRANDNKFISNIEGYHGNIHKLGRLLRHDWFCVTDREGKSKERYLFLFKARILVCKVRRISEDRSVFVLKDIIRLPEVEVKDHTDNPQVFELHHKQSGYGNYPLTISAHKDKVKDAWLTEIRQYASDVLALAEHAADDLRLQETQDNKNIEPLVGVHVEPATPDQTIPLEPREIQDTVLKRSKQSPRTSPEPHKKPRQSTEDITDESNSKPKIVLDEKESVGIQKTKISGIESSLETKEQTTDINKSEAQFTVEEPTKTKVIEIKQTEVKQIDSQLVSKRKEEEQILSVDKKVKFDEAEGEMDAYSSYSSRKSSSRRVEEFRSVSSSSSQEIYVETSSSRHQLSSGISSTRNLCMVEESTMIDGKTVSHTREITGDGGGYTNIQEITSGSEGVNDYAIEDVTHKYKSSGGYSELKDSSSVTDEERIEGYTSKKETSSVKSSEKRENLSRSISVKKPVFLKTIEGMNIEPGHKAVFECEVEDKAKVLWLKDNKPLEDKYADRITAASQSEKKHRLQILAAHENDSGTYTARATNDEGGISSCTAHLLVETLSDEEKKRRKEANAPYFLVSLHDTELLENTYLRFMVKVKGSPNPEVKFYKNDRLITVANERIQIMKEQGDKGFYELIIPDVQEEDKGTYKCIAMNKFGEAECEGTVTVTDDKNLFEGLTEADLLKPGESPNFTWFRDGKPFNPEERFKVLFQDEEDSLALVFQHVKPEDAGLYTCVASTTTGKISCSAELTVQGAVNELNKEPQKPKIITEIKEQEASIGGQVMLDFKVEGYPNPDVKWTKNGEELTAGQKYKMLYEDQESMSLVIKSITSEDAGEYKVEAKNDLGVDAGVIHLTVKSPPKIKRKLTDTSGMAGENIKLTVEIDGYPKPEVTWYKDGKVITKSDRVKTFDEESASFTLLIEKATLDDSGSYSLVATNELSQISEFCKLEIHSAPQFIKTMTKNFVTNEGDTVTFLVKIQGDPTPTVTWLHNGSEVKADGNHTKISEDGQTHTLVVHGTNRFDAGKYTCEIKNTYGVATDGSELNVRCSPLFRTKLEDKTAREGDTNVEFTVNVEAYPKPSIKWYHNEVEVTEKTTQFTRIEEGDNFKLVVKEVTKELSGKYSCVVTNDLGKTDCDAKFTVKYKPCFTKGLVDTQVDEGASLTLQIEVEGTPEPVIKWFKDGEEVSGDAHIKITRDSQRLENYSLTFTLVKAEDAGVYEVHASNEMGTTATISTVTVQTAPEIVSSNVKDIETYETLGVKYEIIARGIPRPDSKWLKDGVEVKETDKIKLTDEGVVYGLEIKKLKLEDAGTYKCKLSNRLGEIVETGVIAIAPESAFRLPKIKVPLQDMTIPKGEDAVFTIVLTADPVPDTKWTHDDHEIDENFTLKNDTAEIDNGLKECTYTLTIPAGRHKDTGNYRFVAKNKYGTDESSARLDIVFRPEIICFKDVTTTPFEDIELVAHIAANPRPKIAWTVDKKAVKLDEHISIDDDLVKEVYKLMIKNVGTVDANTYTVTATNNVGETVGQAKLLVHTEVPTILKPIQSEVLKDYTPFEFKIRANGVPKPKITWLKDGKPVRTSENVSIVTNDEGQVSSTLSFAHFSVEDVGKYTVQAANLAGDAESTADLRMTQTPPTIKQCLDRAVDVAEGEPLELKIKADGSPLPSIKWTKDGLPLTSNEHVKIVTLPDGSSKLTIDSIKPTDCGAYKVLATSPNGDASSICAVAVTPSPRRPSFSKELKDVKAMEGEPLKLEAQVFAFPLPEMKWTKDGIPVRQSPGVSYINSAGGLVGLSIEKVKPEDAGTYTLTLKNKLGDASSTAKVEVETKEKKPQFLSQLMPVLVVEGFPAKLEMKVTGHPPPELSWTMNGKPIVADGQHIKIIDSPDGTQCLIIDKATRADEGVYAVTAKNKQGEATSQAPIHVTAKGRLDVPELPPSFPKGLRDTSTDEGTPLIFSTQFLGNPIPDVTWLKDGDPLEADERIQFTCDGNKVGLEINPSKLSDAGGYTCKLKSPLGEAETSAKAGVKKVFDKPCFTQPLSDVQQLNRLDAKLFARVTGFPRPDIMWYKDGQPLNESEKYRMKREGDAVTLYVQDCDPLDTGIYRCIASNKEGLATCDAQLSVVDKLERKEKAEPPSFLKKIGDCEVFKGMTAKFTACATGAPDPDVEWFKDDEKIYPSDRIRMEKEGTGLLRLTIMRVNPMVDTGKYCCHIFNPHGEASCEAQLVYDSLEPRPKRPVGEQYSDYDKFHASGVPVPLADKPIISRMTDRRLTLSWKPSIPIGPRDPVTYQVEMCELPNGEWFTARTGVRSCACDIGNLVPFKDYKFRIRVENKYGVSDPSPFAQTYREKLLPDPPKFVPYLPPDIDFRPETSPYFPKDFDIERPPHDGYAQAPRFLRQEHDVQYGVKNQNSSLFWFVYGYPKPVMSYYFNDLPIELGGGRYDASYTRNGQATLFINSMLDRDVGVYEAVARNEHGEARQRVRMEIAEYPQFLKRPEETVIMMRKSGRLEARVIGVPYPEIKWYKDWQPLAPSSRIKIIHYEPDVCSLTIHDAIAKDEGLYSISARNVAGCISSSVMVRIEENESEFGYMTYSQVRPIRTKSKTLAEFYDLGDELGRGTQGITYHAVERLNGRNYAAKVMHGKGDLKPLMINEMDIMNSLNHRKIIRLHDAYETPHTVTLITELAAGGELLNSLTKQTYTTESEIAGYIRQLLHGLEHMHDHNIGHLGLTPGDLLISHAGGDDLKICDFGLSRRIVTRKPLEYGMPEFVAPEIVNKESVGLPADMWSVGVITHLLLTGISLFRGADDRTTLTNIKENQWSFRKDIWKYLSSEAKDFITKLLIYEQDQRMDIKDALKHPWLHFADKSPPDQYCILTDTLRNYYNSLKDWYSNASCRNWYRRRPLEGAFTHPSRMVYPPGDIYTPEPTPERKSKEPYSSKTWEDQIPSREPITYDIGLVKSESHYQNGPDTYLLQLRDVNFPVRLREYMKVAANRSPGYSREIADNNHLDWRAPVIRERRRFTDIMDEEIDDERKARINQYGIAETGTLRRLRHELGTRLDAHVEADALLASKRDGQAPFFREKPQILPIQEEHNAELVCFAVGDPKPTVQWFKNDLVITESNRLKITEDEAGRSILRFQPALSLDVGIYKVVARNKVGQVTARTRVVLASVPNAPDSPDVTEISDTEVLLRWKQPHLDGNSPVVCYNLQFKPVDATDWQNVASNIDHEFYLVKDLQPNLTYQFRIAAMNRIGWSPKGIPTEGIKTKEDGAPKIQISRAMKHLQSLSENGHDVVIEETKPILDYSTELFPIKWSDEQPTDKYNFISEIARGRFSVVVKAIDKSNDQVVVAKIMEWRPDTEMQVNNEFDVLKTLKHERIAALTHAIRPANSTVAVLIQEKLQGADVLTYFSSRHEYTEQMVATVVTQVLDALQYLHWRGLCHLDIQPDNVVMASVRSVQVKLVDMGSAQRVTKLGTLVEATGHLDYSAPEVICQEAAFHQSDIWSVGVLTYVLLSGASPFKGETSEETKQNINFVRYRFEHLYKELTQEATRFLMLVFKRTPMKRPTAEECHEHRWLQPTEYMIKRRDRAVFLGNRLKDYADKYHSEKGAELTMCESLTSAVGRSNGLARSNSIQEELLTAF